MSDLVVFDLCDTLVAENTTIGFLRLLASSHPPVDRALRRWTDRSSPFFWFGALAHRLGHDLARQRLIASLKSLSREAIERGANAYADQAGARLNASVVARLEAHKAGGQQVKILSSSLDPVVRALASTLGVAGEGSKLRYIGPVSDGNLASDMTGRKLDHLGAQGDTLVAAYSDNASDLALLRAADHGVLVVPRGGTVPPYLPEGVDEVLLA